MLFIFDWDGTLCNSLDKIVHSIQLAAADVGLPIPKSAAAKEIVGLSLEQAMKQVFVGITSDQMQRMLEAYRQHFNAPSAHGMPFFPGVKDTLDTLLEAGHWLAIATGKRRQGLDKILSDMSLCDYFHGSRCADETESKPHPKMLSELLDEFDVGAHQAVMVGDTEYDLAMAQAIKMPRLAVSYGAHSIERLKVYEPVACVDKFPQLLDWVPEESPCKG